MIFYHRTRQEYAASILSDDNGLGIRASFYNLPAYLQTLFNEAFLQLPEDFIEKHIDLNKEYIVIDECGNETSYEAMYLGAGLYCFSECNLATAQSYRSNRLDTLLKIQVDSQKCLPTDIFDMTSKANMGMLRKFLHQDFPKVYKKLDVSTKKYYEKLQEVLLAAIRVQFRGVPHCAGIILELFQAYLQSEYKIVKSSFIFGGEKWYVEEYVSIKDMSIIEKVELA